MRRYYNVLSQTLLAHGPEAQDATERDDGALHARKGPMNEGQVEGYQGAYGLKWSREMSYVPSILTSQTYSSLIEKARKVINSSDRYREVPEFIALSGLRVGEALDAIRLYHNDAESYLNLELMS
mgnify:CR=1 FL=1